MRKSGINSSTPNDFLLGAGVVFKNFKYLYKKYEGDEQTDAKDIKLSKVTVDVSLFLVSISRPEEQIAFSMIAMSALIRCGN